MSTQPTSARSATLIGLALIAAACKDEPIKADYRDTAEEDEGADGGDGVIPSSTRIFVCMEPQDMRRGFDGLALAAQEQLGEDPQSGALFVFTNKRKNRLKVLWFDRNGYCLLYKRLHRARFVLGHAGEVDARRLAFILRGVETSRRGTRRG